MTAAHRRSCADDLCYFHLRNFNSQSKDSIQAILRAFHFLNLVSWDLIG